MNSFNSSNNLKVGDVVQYVFKERPCRIIATKSESHKQRFGNKEIDKEGYERPVPEGFDFTIVELGLEFSPYIDIKFSAIR